MRCAALRHSYIGLRSKHHTFSLFGFHFYLLIFGIKKIPKIKLLIFGKIFSIIYECISFFELWGGIILDYKQFFEQIKGKKIAMCGIGISNTPLIMEFLNMGAKVYACEEAVN